MINNNIIRSVLSSVGYNDRRASYLRARTRLETLGYMIPLLWDKDGWRAECYVKGKKIDFECEPQKTSMGAARKIIDYMCLNNLIHVGTDNE